MRLSNTFLCCMDNGLQEKAHLCASGSGILPAGGTIMGNSKSCCLKHWPCQGSRLCREVVQTAKEECAEAYRRGAVKIQAFLQPLSEVGMAGERERSEAGSLTHHKSVLSFPSPASRGLESAGVWNRSFYRHHLIETSHESWRMRNDYPMLQLIWPGGCKELTQGHRVMKRKQHISHPWLWTQGCQFPIEPCLTLCFNVFPHLGGFLSSEAGAIVTWGTCLMPPVIRVSQHEGPSAQ